MLRPPSSRNESSCRSFPGLGHRPICIHLITASQFWRFCFGCFSSQIWKEARKNQLWVRYLIKE